MKKEPKKVSSLSKEETKNVDKRKFVIVSGLVLPKKEYNKLVKDSKSVVAEDVEARTTLKEEFCKKNELDIEENFSKIYRSILKTKKPVKKIIKDFQKEQAKKEVEAEVEVPKDCFVVINENGVLEELKDETEKIAEEQTINEKRRELLLEEIKYDKEEKNNYLLFASVVLIILTILIIILF